MEEQTAATSRKAGLTFKPVNNAHFSVSHAERTELHEPEYLLKPVDRLPCKTIYAIGDEDFIANRFEESALKMSAQAKRAKKEKGDEFSHFWEAVVVLPAVEDFDNLEDYQEAIDNRLLKFKEDFERLSGCTVLHISSHLDEGAYDPVTGLLKRNPHAHILVDRTVSADHVKQRKRHQTRSRENKRKDGATLLWTPGRSELACVQTLYADTMQLTRGSTIQERGGAPSRKNIPHQEYRQLMERLNVLRLEQKLSSDADLESAIRYVNESEKYKQDAAYKRGYDAGFEDGDAYGFLRGYLVASKQAKQADYQRLKALKGKPELREWAELVELEKLGVQELQELLDGAELAEVLVRREIALEADSAVPVGMFSGDGDAPHLDVDKTLRPMVHWLSPKGKDLYLVPGAPTGQKVGFQDHGEKLSIMRADDDAVLKAALVLASQKWPSGVVLTGSEAFKERALGVALELGITIHQGPQNGSVYER